jgi:hypothetical protein
MAGHAASSTQAMVLKASDEPSSIERQVCAS